MMDHDRQTSSGLTASVLRAAGVVLPWEEDKDGLTVLADLYDVIYALNGDPVGATWKIHGDQS